MSHPAARVDDTIDHGGKITEGSPNVIHGASGKAFARVGDHVQCDQHGLQTITSGAPRTKLNDKVAAWVTSDVSCGAKVITGAPNVEWNE